MKGSPAKLGTISGTAGHSSALKMKADADAASALKQKEERETSWWRGEEGLIPDELQPNVNRPKVKTEHGKNVEAEKEAEKTTKETNKKVEDKKMSNKDWKKGMEKSGGTLNELVKQRKGLKKGTPEYAKVQNKINEALGSKKRYDEGATTTTTGESTITTTTGEPTKTEKVIAKGDKKIGEVKENVSKKTAKIAKKEARKEFGKGSKEHLKAKKAHLEAKATDIQGGKGGRKRGLFRKLATKINLGRQKKTQAKIDALNEEENA